MLKGLTIKRKIYTLATLAILISLFIAGGAIYSINIIGKQLKQVAEEDIPLTAAVSKITVHQLEQAVLFERAIRLAETALHNPSVKGHYEETKDAFLKLAKKVDQEIIEAKKLTDEIIKYETSHGGDPEVINEFLHVQKNLKDIEKEHTEFDHHVEEAFSLYDSGKIKQAEHLTEQIEKEEDELDHHLEELLFELASFTEKSALHAEETEKKILKTLAISSIIITILFTILAFAIVRSIIAPLTHTKNYAGALSNDRLDALTPEHDSKDEIKEMIETLDYLKERAIDAKNLRKEQQDMANKLEIEKNRSMQELADGFDNQVGDVIDALVVSSQKMQSTAEDLKTIANETKESSQTVTKSSEQSSVNVNTVASAMEEMSATSSEIASQISSASAQSNDTAKNAHEANSTVSNLNELVNNIGEVVTSIQDIAEQTNLLALNATIEAARAGESGKGFAVVADEVKKLASETAQKTEEISSKIAEIQGATHSSVKAMQRIISNISEIDTSVTGVSAAVTEQNATTAEITRSVTEASLSTQQVSHIIQNVQENAERTGSSADNVLTSAEEVASLSEKLKSTIYDFLEDMQQTKH